MKALTLRDYPEAKYATWVELGLKDIESRKWKPEDWKEGMIWDLLITCSKSSPTPNAGKAIVVVELYHIEEMTTKHEERCMCPVYPRNKKGDPAWAFYFRNRRTLSRKFDVTGALSIFNIDLPEDIILTPAKPHYATELSINEKRGLLF